MSDSTNSEKVNTSDFDSKYYIGADKVFQFSTIAWSYWYLHNALNKVGDGFADHGYWGRPEEMNMARPTFTLNTNAPGSDLAAETAAALVWFSIQFLIWIRLIEIEKSS